jgi:3-phosphoshikimate 1-carboxyvinyltransferase
LFRIPGDKSLSHRVALFSLLAPGVTEVRGWLQAGDTLSTLEAVQQLGVEVQWSDDETMLLANPGIQPPDQPLDLGRAGTGARLLAGMLAGQPFASRLDGEEQLRRRPMGRIVDPLLLMGADIESTDGRLPLSIKPVSTLKGIEYHLPMSSAQVQSCVMLAGLFADGPTTIVEPGPCRDHTERLLTSMGANIQREGNRVTITPGNELRPLSVWIPGDPSSAAFILVAALVTEDSDVVLDNVLLNPTRMGLVDTLKAMGGDIEILSTEDENGEPTGQIRVRSSQLKGMRVSGKDIVRMIDEIPLLMVAALAAEGDTIVENAEELRLKESDRLSTMCGELERMGAVIEQRSDGFRLTGKQQLKGTEVDSHEDHRVAMSLSVAAMIAEGVTKIRNAACIEDSFPEYVELMQDLSAEMRWFPSPRQSRW